MVAEHSLGVILRSNCRVYL